MTPIVADANCAVADSINNATVAGMFPSNRWTSVTHDTFNGYVVNDGWSALDYDVEGRVTKSARTTGGTNFEEYNYYDGDGRRVRRETKSGASPTTMTVQTNTVHAYDASGALSAEYTTAGAGSVTGLRFLTTDHLGSTRLVTDAGGLEVARHDYMPFGQEWPTRAPVVDTLFTGKERDAETGLDYFGARYMSAAQGRFTSPDPLYIEASRLLDPQSLNLYSYVRNNPLKFVDPDGMDFVLNCNGSQENCQQTVADINNRKGAGFQVQLGKGNKLEVVKGSIAKNLSKGETALLNAVNDSSSTGTINVFAKDSGFNFEKYDKAGQNSVDRADLNLLGGANKELPGEVVAHAMMESYNSGKTGNSYEEAHGFANQFFGQIKYSDPLLLPQGSRMVTGLDYIYRFGRNNLDVTVIKTFDTPVPIQSLRGLAPRGNVTSVTNPRPIGR